MSGVQNCSRLKCLACKQFFQAHTQMLTSRSYEDSLLTCMLLAEIEDSCGCECCVHDRLTRPLFVTRSMWMLLQGPSSLSAAGVQPRLITRWREVHGSSKSPGCREK